MKPIYLKKREDKRLKAGHLWIFSNEIDVSKTPLSSFESGDLVLILNNQEEKIGIGYIQPQSLLCVRLLSRDPNEKINSHFFVERFKIALKLREQFYEQPFYRLIYADSDLLPGLIIDRYNEFLVVQIATAGMERLKENIIEALQKLFKPKTIIFRNDLSAREKENLSLENEVLGEEILSPILLKENDAVFLVDLLESQKTGWYFDQKYNRNLFSQCVKNKRILDVYSYNGAFGIQAALKGAKEVYCIDSSAKAISMVQKNAELNGVSDKIHTITGDAIKQMNALLSKQTFDVVLLDPPAFIKKRKDIPQGTKAYLKMNELALKLLNNEGFLITSSCSMHFLREHFISVLSQAAKNANNFLQIIAEGQQAPDHPIHPAIPETFYLKTFFCRAVNLGSVDNSLG